MPSGEIALVAVLLASACGGSAVQPNPFLARWCSNSPSGSTAYVESCPGAPTTTFNMMNADLEITLGASAESIAVSNDEDQCVRTYSVSGNVATVEADQIPCTFTDNINGTTHVATVQVSTLTLASDRKTLVEVSSGTSDATSHGMTAACTWNTSVTYSDCGTTL
jgi:hypothetical protein